MVEFSSPGLRHWRIVVRHMPSGALNCHSFSLEHFPGSEELAREALAALNIALPAIRSKCTMLELLSTHGYEVVWIAEEMV